MTPSLPAPRPRTAPIGIRTALLAVAGAWLLASSVACGGSTTSTPPATECTAGQTRPCGPQPVGACRQGVQACVGGTFETGCPGQVLPSTEVCDVAQVDEDCDGAVNEGCGCAPVGATVACCSARGLQTCQATAGGTEYSACSVAPATEACNGIDDDCDGLVDEEVPPLCSGGATCTAGACACAGGAAKLDCYVDADNDGWTPSLTELFPLCPVANRPTFGYCPIGHVLPGTEAGVDCDDTNPTLFQASTLRADADNDTYCVGGSSSQCIGASLPPGLRRIAQCQPTDDCNDASATLYSLAALRTDTDGDGYCVGASSSQCIGASPPGGQRLATACAGVDDCRDTNAQATTACTLVSGYQTSFATKSCGIGQPASETRAVSVTVACPPGFALNASTLQTQKTTGGGTTCLAVGPTLISFDCNLFDSATCRIVGNCNAQ